MVIRAQIAAPLNLAKRIEDVDVADDPDREKQLVGYREGGEGCIRWAEEFISVEIYPYDSVYSVWCPLRELPRGPHPITGRSYAGIWNAQKDILRKALRMEHERFVHRLVVFCWMRGEGKSLLACIVQLWKFFCWTRQKIMLGANSKDQIKFVHFDIMRDIIRNSPELYRAIGKRNLQEKEIRILNAKGEITSLIRSISSFTGILSNITGYTFSEMFDMKNPRFFTQLDGSIRNIPNALGVIDSTVSDKTHVLFNLYTSFKEKKTKLVFFSHRQSNLGVPDDYWNPNMDGDQLNDYRVKFPLGEFEKYFLNTWEAGRIRLFDDRMIEETKYIGIDSGLMNHTTIKEVLEEKEKLQRRMDDSLEKGFNDNVEEQAVKISEINTRFRQVEELYIIGYDYVLSPGATLYDLQRMSDVFDTDWALLGGLDFADPMAVRKQARTLYTLIAKGLVSSRSNPYLIETENAALKFIYLLIRLVNATDHTINYIKEIIDEDHTQLAGIDSLCCERYGSWDLITWCEDRDIAFEPIAPVYNRQREAFKEFYTVMNEGRFKCPPVGVPGSRKEDIFVEEAELFDHDPDKKWFGSNEKEEKGGIQDDVMYSIGWTIYGGRLLGPADFRARNLKLDFGTFLPEKTLLGNY